MKNKIIPLVLSAVSCLYGSSFSDQIQLDDVYKATDLIWIKNLNIYNAADIGIENAVKVISFDIIFHTSAVSSRICAEFSATDNDKVNIPYAVPDRRQGNQYQHIDICLNKNFVNYVANRDIIRITYGSMMLFSFEACARLQPIHSYRYASLEELPTNLVFTNEVKSPCIKDGKICDTFTESIDLSNFDFEAVKTFYYGLFPDQYFWAKFDTDQFNNKVSGDQLIEDFEGYPMELVAFFYQDKLFLDYHDFGSETLNFPYQLFDYYKPMEKIMGYFHLGYSNTLEKVTFLDGTMRIKSELNDYVLSNRENKSSKFLTFPLDLEDFEKNFELARNMKIAFEFRCGALTNFHFAVTMNLDLQKDFFYNHLQETILIGTHNNEILDTVDTIYA